MGIRSFADFARFPVSVIAKFRQYLADFSKGGTAMVAAWR
jgi:hypothetical protein